MADQYELAELRQAVGRRLGGFYNSFRYAANRALWILPRLSVGKLFTDTLGKFYPFSVDVNGNLTLNSSSNHLTSFLMHNTRTASTDLVLSPYGTGGAIWSPNSVSGVGWTLQVMDRTDLTSWNGLSISALSVGGVQIAEWNAGGGFFFWDQGVLISKASTTVKAGLRVAHGTAPTSPVDGDIWTTTAGMFVRINGVTKTVTLT